MAQGPKVIGQDVINGYLVSTVRLDVPIGPGREWETLIVDLSGTGIEVMMDHYGSELAAIAGHDQMREHAKDLLFGGGAGGTDDERWDTDSVPKSG